VLARESRMDCVVVLEKDRTLSVKEFRRLVPGDLVACGRSENGEDGIFVHANAFGREESAAEKFAFRRQISRETSFSYDYDELYGLLEHERQAPVVTAFLRECARGDEAPARSEPARPGWADGVAPSGL
jgi:hypothetical protein